MTQRITETFAARKAKGQAAFVVICFLSLAACGQADPPDSVFNAITQQIEDQDAFTKIDCETAPAPQTQEQCFTQTHTPSDAAPREESPYFGSSKGFFTLDSFFKNAGWESKIQEGSWDVEGDNIYLPTRNLYWLENQKDGQNYLIAHRSKHRIAPPLGQQKLDTNIPSTHVLTFSSVAAE